jgi:hypothetical protein
MGRAMTTAVVFLFLSMAGCQNVRQDEVAAVINPLQSDGRRLGWGGLWIGMTRAEAEKVAKLSFVENGAGQCAQATARVRHQGKELSISLSGKEQAALIRGIDVPLSASGTEASPGPLKSALKTRIANLVYVPSVHTPDLTEEKNPTPTYALKENDQMVILLKPSDSLFVGLSECLD